MAYEFIREIGELEAIRTTNEKEMQEASVDGKLLVTVHFCTQMRTELMLDVNMLHKLHFKDKDLTYTAYQLANLDQQKIGLYDETKKIAQAFISSNAKPNTDYGKLMARMPEIRAEIEDIDKSISKNITTLICLSLKDPKSPEWLVITKEQEEQLISELEGNFDERMHQKEMPYFVWAASLMHGFLKDAKVKGAVAPNEH